VPNIAAKLSRQLVLGVILAALLVIPASSPPTATILPTDIGREPGLFVSLSPMSPSLESPPQASMGGPVTGFVSRAGTHLIENGAIFRFRGLNLYNINGDGDCGYAIPDLDAELDAIGGSANVVRGWFFQYLATNHRTGARDWKRMDATLATLRARGVRVIATLADEWGACEAANPRGPLEIGWYRHGYRNRPYSADVRSSYRNWVRQIVRRYRDDPTILAWQLMNEATAISGPSGWCPDQDMAAAALQGWAADMAALVKSLDSSHLLSIGTAGSSQCGTTGPRYQAVHATPGIDLCEIHDYTSPWLAMSPGIASDISACRTLQKPIFVGESGISGYSVGHNLRLRASLMEAKFNAQLGAGIAGELVWAWRSRGDGGSSRKSFDIGPGDPLLAVLRWLPTS
jgi:mannan endo-1,4-beta-mannosidase